MDSDEGEDKDCSANERLFNAKLMEDLKRKLEESESVQAGLKAENEALRLKVSQCEAEIQSLQEQLAETSDKGSESEESEEGSESEEEHQMDCYAMRWLINAKLMEAADQEKIDSALAQQIALVGSRRLYERINKNFKEIKFEAVFAKEHFDLFSWRKDFFYSQFGTIYEGDVWFTDGGDDTHLFEVHPYQITQKFDDVLALASAPRPELPNRIFFDHDDDLSMKVDHLYDGERVKSNLRILRHSTNELRDFGITSYTDVLPRIGINSYTDALHIILVLFQDQPLSLKFLGMKKVCELDLEVKELPEELQINTEKGFFTSAAQVIPFVDEKGREILEKLRSSFGKTT